MFLSYKKINLQETLNVESTKLCSKLLEAKVFHQTGSPNRLNVFPDSN